MRTPKFRGHEFRQGHDTGGNRQYRLALSADVEILVYGQTPMGADDPGWWGAVLKAKSDAVLTAIVSVSRHHKSAQLAVDALEAKLYIYKWVGKVLAAVEQKRND